MDSRTKTGLEGAAAAAEMFSVKYEVTREWSYYGTGSTGWRRAAL